MRVNKVRCLLRASLLLLFPLISQKSGSQEKHIVGEVQRIKIHGKELEGNLDGDSADRFVCVYLPASYKSNPRRRYPVIYFLHGYTDDDAKFYGFSTHWMNLVPILDSVFASGEVKEMIVVTPNAYTRFQGSMYSSSVTIGNWDDFISKELVSYIDSHYRTIANSSARGLAGHSMGGYGALRIGEKNPGVFSAIYLLSPCCLNSPTFSSQVPANFLRADSIRTITEFQKTDFGTKTVFASAAAWSPNPAQPPFYLDLPVKDGVIQPGVLAKWNANRPLVTLDQYINNLKKLKGIAFDAGTKDQAIAASIRTLDEELNKYGVKHFFEIYDGDHVNRVAVRIRTIMLKFFSETLVFPE